MTREYDCPIEPNQEQICCNLTPGNACQPLVYNAGVGRQATRDDLTLHNGTGHNLWHKTATRHSHANEPEITLGTRYKFQSGIAVRRGRTDYPEITL